MLKRVISYGLHVLMTACFAIPVAVQLAGWVRWAFVAVWVLNSVMWAAFGAAEAFRWIASVASPYRVTRRV